VRDVLVQLRWVGQLAAQEADVEPVFVLLAEPELTMLEPLAERLLLKPSEATAKMRLAAQWHRTPLSAVL
jgi:membrane protein